MQDPFRRFSHKTSDALGAPRAFFMAALAVVTWALAGFLFEFSDVWSRAFDLTTAVVTFLLVFVIQNTQNRDTKATQLKLDELLRALEGARTTMAGLEQQPDDQMERVEKEFRIVVEKEGGGRTEVESVIEEERPVDPDDSR